MARIVNPLPAGPTNEASILEFESYIGHMLPDDYRSFLLQHNGGSADPDAFTLSIFGKDQENVVYCFFPLRDLKLVTVEVEGLEGLEGLRTWPLQSAWDDLQHDLVNLYEKELENPVLPIGTDGSGNYFCLVLDGEQRGAILFLENEMADTVLLADSFLGFLDTLQPRERTDYAPEFG